MKKTDAFLNMKKVKRYYIALYALLYLKENR